MIESVRTAVRWRIPTENKEIAVEKLSENAIGIKEDKFEFGKVIDGGTQSEIYDVLTKPMVDKAFEGYDSTFFAYGQSGTGKTYTMGFNVSDNSDDNGIAVRIADDIFSRPKIAEMNVFISFIEIYNTKVYDFLSEKSTKALPTKSLKNLNAVKKLVNNESEFTSLLSCCSKTRRVRATSMNSKSSRSHAILTIYIAHMQQEETISESSINLVDLAGIEGVRNTDHTGEAFTEGSNINKDLLFVSKVIEDISRKRQVISFRNSSLTMLLQDSLNMRSYLTLLVCISPYIDDVSGTLATLNLAKIAKSIKLAPQLNIEYQSSKTPTTMKNVVSTRNISKNRLPRLKSTSRQNSFVKRTPLKSLTNRKQNNKFSGIPVSSKRPSSLINADANIQSSPSNSNSNNNVDPNVNSIDSTLTNGCKSRSIEASPILLPDERPRITPIVRQIRENYCKNWSTKDLRLLASRLVDFPSSSVEQNAAVETQLSLPFFPLSLENRLTEPPHSTSKDNLIIEPQLNVLLPETENNDLLNEESVLISSTTEIPSNLVVENVSRHPLSTLKKERNERRRINEKLTENKCDSVVDNNIPITNMADSTNIIESTPNSLLKRNHSDCDSEYFLPEMTRQSKRQKSYRNLGAEASTNRYAVTSPVQRSAKKRNLASKPVRIDNTLHTLRSTRKKNPPKNELKEKCSPGSKNYNPLNNALVTSSTPFKSIENTAPLRRSARKSRKPEIVSEHLDVGASTVAAGSRSILSNARAPKIVIRKANDNKGCYTSTLIAPDKKKRKRLTLFEGPEKNVTSRRNSSTDLENNILNILNNGSVKDIQELATFGKKTANLIFNYRNSNGVFESIKALEKIQFVNYKLFLSKNNLLK